MRRTLAAIAMITSLASAAQAGLEKYYFPIEDNNAVIVDGSETSRWPIDFKDLTLCTIPIKLNLGMYVEISWPAENIEDENDTDVPEPNDVEVEKYNHTKIVLQPVLCSDIGRESSDWPCYLDCIDINIRANFQVKLETKLVKTDNIIDQWEAYFDGTDIITDSGEYETVRVCVKAWKARLLNAPAGERDVGTLFITVKPDI